MEDVQYTHRVVDTYGNIIATTEVETPQRAFLDDTLLQSKHAYRGEDQDTIKDAVLSFSTRSDVFQDANSKFSFAHECQYCELLVCTACKDRTIAIQQEKEREEMEREQERKKEMEAVLAKEAVDKEKVLAEQADTETQDISPAIHD
jgi:thiol:disulfide interchange protein